MNFLKNLDYLLKSNHMSRSDLGRAVNIAPSTINSWFNRSSDGVALKSLVDISKYFNISLDMLVNGENIEDYKAEKKESPLTDQEVAQVKRLLKYYDLLNNIGDIGGGN